MGIMNVIGALIRNFKNWMTGMRQRRSALRQWIQNHGIEGLFSAGVWMYLYDDTNQSFDFLNMAWYIDALYIVARQCMFDGFVKNGQWVVPQESVKKFAIPFNDPQLPLDVGNMQLPTKENALTRIQNLNPTKTKIVINDQNKNTITELFFAITNDAMMKFDPSNKEQTVKLRSRNVYNSIQYLLEVSDYYGLRTGDLIKGFQSIGEGSSNRQTIFYTDRNKYNEDYRQLKIVVQGYSKLSKCFSHDLKVLVWVNNEALKRMQSHDTNNNNPSQRFTDPEQRKMFARTSDEIKQYQQTRDAWNKNRDTANSQGNTPMIDVNG
jgi:hypothetical protein